MGTTARRGANVVASVLRIVGTVIVAILVVYIVLVLLDANPANTFAMWIRDLAEYFNLGLANLFVPANPKIGVTLNYGVAAIIWYAITVVAVRLVRRIG
ncbi:hypothetical protein [Pseudonocardia sp. GCM10023141]|uniref:hypothetical protein n=1 Tax=Pseudonocardia sp. GCM10023141 TaxID=3252653 RepID=UPI003624555D